VEGVHGEATSYLWYVRSPTCSPSMHGKVSEASNYVNCVGLVRYHRSCSYLDHPRSNNISGPLRQSLDGKGAHISSFVGRLERIVHKSTEIVK
jgi:hypothetical protein